MNTFSSNERELWISGVMLSIGGTALFALKSIFIKFAYAAGATADTLLAMRMLLACPFYIAMLWHLGRHTKQLRQPPATLWKVISLGFLGYFLASWLDLLGLEHISAQLERLTLFTYPTMIAVLAALFLGEKLSGRILLALALSYLGLYLMYAQERNLSGDAEVTLGVLLVLGSALSFSLYVLFSKPIMQKLGSRYFTSLAMIGSTLFVMIQFFSFHGVGDLKGNTTIWSYAALLAFVSTVIPSFMVSEAIVRIGATRATVIGSVGPVLTMLLAIVLLDEPSTPWHFAGMLVCITGVTIVTVKPRQRS